VEALYTHITFFSHKKIEFSSRNVLLF